MWKIAQMLSDPGAAVFRPDQRMGPRSLDFALGSDIDDDGGDVVS